MDKKKMISRKRRVRGLRFVEDIGGFIFELLFDKRIEVC